MSDLRSRDNFLTHGIRRYTHPDNETLPQCSICLETCLSGPSLNVVSLDPCRHTFHNECIREWFTGTDSERNTCPNCRHVLFMGTDSNRHPIVAIRLPTARPRAPLPLQLRFAIHVSEDPNGPGSREDNRLLEEDHQLLQTLVTHLVGVEHGHWEVTGRPWRWYPTVFNNILECYTEEHYPRTDYVTRETLIRLTVAAALIYELAPDPRYNNTIEFAHLLAHGDHLLLRAQQEATTAPGADVQYADQYRRVLGPPDYFVYSNRAGRLAGDDMRSRWIVALRIRVRGPGAHPVFPGHRVGPQIVAVMHHQHPPAARQAQLEDSQD